MKTVNFMASALAEALRHLLALAALALLMFFSSCDNFVEVELPSSQLSSQAVFADASTANAAMLSVFAKMRDTGILNGGMGASMAMGAYADELDYYGNASGAAAPFYNNSLMAANPDVARWWSNAYNQVYGANAVLEGVEASASLPQPVKDRLTGEALFARAFLHFYLASFYGPVPYVEVTDYRINSTLPRLALGEVYDRVASDLEQAVQLLPADYPEGERIRPNKSAAMALLARTHLYNGSWANAANAASAVINDAQYGWETNLDNVFVKAAPGAIWQFMPAVPGRNTIEGQTFIFLSGPPQLVALSPALLGAFEAGDQRLVKWVKTVTNAAGSWKHAFKYKLRTSTATSQEYSIVLRLAEQYLIRAEARARQGELTAALEDLDKVRLRAGLPGSPAATQQEILDAILAERRAELFTEFGHRFLDLKRFDRLNQALTPVKPGWDTTDALLPVPESEFVLNPALSPQNPGY